MSKFFDDEPLSVDDVLRARELMRKSERSLGQLVSQGLIAPRVAKLLHEMENENAGRLCSQCGRYDRAGRFVDGRKFCSQDRSPRAYVRWDDPACLYFEEEPR